MGRALRELYDLVVLGGSPAGATAALRGAKQRASVLVIEQQESPHADSCIEWLGPAGIELCKQCGISAKKAGAAEFAGLRLHSWDLRRSAEANDAELRGWVVDRATFERALIDQARKAGADTAHGVELRELKLHEDRAALRLSDGRDAEGKVVLIADGAASSASRMANLVPAAQMPDLPQCVFAEAESGKQAARLDVVVGTSRTGQLAIILRHGKTVSVSLVSGPGQIPIEEQFRAFRDEALKCGLLPDGVPGEPARRPCPGGVALDMDTHVGKRCLLIGEVGGFAAAFSSERVFPAMRSGWIATDTALRALQAPVLQDELASFGVAWRGELADYLRMPNTDLSLLVPLMFNNEQMSRRVARAFLLGQPF